MARGHSREPPPPCSFAVFSVSFRADCYSLGTLRCAQNKGGVIHVFLSVRHTAVSRFVRMAQIRRRSLGPERVLNSQGPQNGDGLKMVPPKGSHNRVPTRFQKGSNPKRIPTDRVPAGSRQGPKKGQGPQNDPERVPTGSRQGPKKVSNPERILTDRVPKGFQLQKSPKRRE